MLTHDLTEFLKLSSAMNYNLSAASINRYNILNFITDGKRLHPDESTDRRHKSILMEALSYLFNAYHRKRRRLGPMAVIHPLRSAALFAGTQKEINLIDLLTQLFHDILEDISPLKFDHHTWMEMEHQLIEIFERLTPGDAEELIGRMLSLTRLSKESYYQYIGRMLESANRIPEIVTVKLADRLDNTLDMRMGVRDPIEGVDFYKNVFQLLFVRNYPGYTPEHTHQPPMAMNGSRRLYQLFKNAVLLSLIRRNGANIGDRATQILFEAVSEASVLEAQRCYIHVVGYHYRDIRQERKLVMEAMAYCHGGRSDLVTKPETGQPLDGLFTTYFAHPDNRVRNTNLDMLYQNKPLMAQASLAFITIFIAFLNDPDFFVRGISSAGVTPA